MAWILTPLVALAATWLTLALVLAIRRPEPDVVKGALRLLPDTVRLARRLATDARVPRPSRILLWLLIAYLMSPIDIVPDFLPIIGVVDDVVLSGLVLRHVVRSSGAAVLTEQWPGTPAGLETLRRVLRIRVAQPEG